MILICIEQTTFTILLPVCVNSSTCGNDAVQGALDLLDILQSIILLHCIFDIIMLIKLKAWVKRTRSRRWDKPYEDSGAYHSHNIFKTQSSGGVPRHPCKVKDKLSPLPPSTVKKEAQQVVLFGFRRQHNPHLGILLQPIYRMVQRVSALSEAQMRKTSAVPSYAASSPAAGATQFSKSYSAGGKRCWAEFGAVLRITMLVSGVLEQSHAI